MDRKYLKWLLPLLVAAVAAGIGVWWATRPAPVHKSDCEIVSEMLSYNKSQIAAINQASQSEDWSAYDTRTREYTDKLQEYTNEIADSETKTDAQAVVDTAVETGKAREELRKEAEASPAADPSNDPIMDKIVAKAQELGKKQTGNLDKLQQRCPGTVRPS